MYKNITEEEFNEIKAILSIKGVRPSRALARHFGRSIGSICQIAKQPNLTAMKAYYKELGERSRAKKINNQTLSQPLPQPQSSGVFSAFKQSIKEAIQPTPQNEKPTNFQDQYNSIITLLRAIEFNTRK